MMPWVNLVRAAEWIAPESISSERERERRAKPPKVKSCSLRLYPLISLCPFLLLLLPFFPRPHHSANVGREERTNGRDDS